jgi:hypothetical protein
MSDFWPEHLHRSDGDPVEYFTKKLPKIMARWRGAMQAKQNAERRASSASAPAPRRSGGYVADTAIPPGFDLRSLTN